MLSLSKTNSATTEDLASSNLSCYLDDLQLRGSRVLRLPGLDLDLDQADTERLSMLSSSII